MQNAITYLAQMLKSKDFWIRILFVFIAASFWLLIKLSKNGYVTSLEYPVLYENIPDSKQLIGNPVHQITLRVSSYGFRLIGYQINNALPLRIDVKRQTRKFAGKEDVYYWLPNLYREELQAQLDGQTSLVRLEPDTVYLQLSEKVKKLVEVKAKATLAFKKGFEAYGEAEIIPKVVTIYGPQSLLDSIHFVETESFSLENINSNQSLELKLNLSDPMLSSPKSKITYKLDVDQFTEKVLQVPIRLTNVPKGYKSTIMPSNIEVFCKVALRDVELLHSNDIDVICDFSQLKKHPERQHLQLAIKSFDKKFVVSNTSHKSVNFLLFKQ